MSDWIVWGGGECPVPDGSVVDVRLRSGEIRENRIAWSDFSGEIANANATSVAGRAFWRHDMAASDITAYRLADQATVPDLVNAPPHYKQGEIECIDAIRSALTRDEFKGHCKANAIKYIWRSNHKGGDESIRKAIWYLEEMLK